MPYGLHFTSIDPMKRRMAQSADSVSPGFTGIVASIDIDSKRCDVWVQGTDTVLKAVRFGIGIVQIPDYIKIGSAVYLRHPRGNKFQLEISGPAFAIPSVSAGGVDGPLPPIPTAEDFITGISLGAYATGKQDLPSPATKYVPIVRTNPQALFNGVVYGPNDFPLPKLGDTFTSLVSGFTPGVMKVGNANVMGFCYMTIPIGTSGSSYEINSIEVGKSDRKIYIQTSASSAGNPEAPVTPAGRMRIGTILSRPDQTKVFSTDINVTLGTTNYRVSVSPNQRSVAYSSTGTYANLQFIVLVRDASGTNVAGMNVSAILGSLPGVDPTLGTSFGSINSSSTTNLSGQAGFQYTRLAGTNRSTIITFTIVPASGSGIAPVSAYARVYNGTEYGIYYA